MASIKHGPQGTFRVYSEEHIQKPKKTGADRFRNPVVRPPDTSIPEPTPYERRSAELLRVYAPGIASHAELQEHASTQQLQGGETLVHKLSQGREIYNASVKNPTSQRRK